MVEADPGNLLFLQEIEYFPNFICVGLVDGKPEPDLDSHCLAIFNTLHGRVESALDTPERIVDGCHPIETDANIGKADVFQFTCHLGCNECAVGGDDCAHSFLDRILSQIGQVFSHQGFPAREEENRDTKCDQVVDEPLAFLGCEFVAFRLFCCLGIAVDAFQVAAACNIPDHDRSFVGRELKKMRG